MKIQATTLLVLLLILACDQAEPEPLPATQVPAPSPVPVATVPVDPPQPPQDLPEAPPEPVSKGWSYEKIDNAMGDHTVVALARSREEFVLAFPYDEPQQARLSVRDKNGELDVMLSILHGQFSCMFGCTVEVRFGDKKKVKWNAEASSTSTTIFFRRPEDFIAELEKASVTNISMSLYDSPPVIVSFEGGFSREKMK